MLTVEFDEVKRILNGRYKICEDQTEIVRWFEALKTYDFLVVKEAVNDWIINDGWKPEVVNIVERCKDVIRWRQQARVNEEPNERTIACPYCHDSGLIITKHPTGVNTGKPCPHCSRGKKNYPWTFLSEEERREYNEKEIKAGRQVPKYHEAPKDFYLAYVYGVAGDGQG